MVFRAGVVVPGGSQRFRRFTERSNACGQLCRGTPAHSCSQTTSVAYGPRRWGSKSCLRRSQIVSFDLRLRDSKHSKRKSRTDFHLLFVGETHTHSSPFRNASAPVSVLCSKLEDNGPIKRVRADEATIFCLVRAWCARSRSGRCAGRVAGVIFLV